MIETEIKKLREAIEGLTAQLASGSTATAHTATSGTPDNTASPAAKQQLSAAYQPPAQPQTQPPAQPQGQPAGGYQPPAQPQTQPPAQPQQQPAQTQGSGMSHQDAQNELTQIAQQMGDPAPLQQLLMQYTNTGQLSGVAADALPHLVNAAKALLPQGGAQ